MSENDGQMPEKMDMPSFGVMGPFVVGSILQSEVWGNVPLIRADHGTSHTKALGRDITSGHLPLVRLK